MVTCALLGRSAKKDLQFRVSRNFRSPAGSRSNSGGSPFGQGMTPCLSIHLPIVELLSSGQVVQNVSGGDTSDNLAVIELDLH